MHLAVSTQAPAQLLMLVGLADFCAAKADFYKRHVQRRIEEISETLLTAGPKKPLCEESGFCRKGSSAALLEFQTPPVNRSCPDLLNA